MTHHQTPLRKLYPEQDLFFRNQPGHSPIIVYLLHFSRPYHHARHYVGSCFRDRFLKRMEEHEDGANGAALTRAVRKAGIPWTVAKTWEANRHFEYWIRTHIKHTSRVCPICHFRMDYDDRIDLPEDVPF